ncbi:MAG TPA: hypothetical protein VGL34_03400 [Steroidobacteraceae bacterium]|jgi:hypothetical protein
MSKSLTVYRDRPSNAAHVSRISPPQPSLLDVRLDTADDEAIFALFESDEALYELLHSDVDDHEPFYSQEMIQ